MLASLQSARDSFVSDGAVLIKNLLSEDQLAECRDVFDWAVRNPGPNATSMYAGSVHQSHVDNANPRARPWLDELMTTMPFGRMFADLWGASQVWYFAEEIFLKGGGLGGRTLWHQDTSYLPWAGMHWGNAWVSFEAVPKQNALEIIKGSHLGPRHDGTTFRNHDDPTEPLHGGGNWPTLPDVEAERRSNPNAYEIISFATEPGDVVVLHPATLHGGAAVDEAFPDRHTLVLRFFGDDATFSPLPDVSRSGYARNGQLFAKEMASLNPGDPFRSQIFRQIV